MKSLLLVAYAGLLATTFSCKKIIDKTKEAYVLGIMTDGRWFLDNYTEYGMDHTADFADYDFQFYEDNRVDAIMITVVTPGTWSADVNNISMMVNFTSAADNLKRLNHTWKITDSYTNMVFAETTTPLGIKTIRLKKR